MDEKFLPQESLLDQLKAEISEGFFQAAELAKLDPVDKTSYEQSLKYYRDLNNVINTAFDEGKEAGMIEGIEQSWARGIEEGSAEASTEIAKRMKTQGLDYEMISQLTGLSIEEIKAF